MVIVYQFHSADDTSTLPTQIPRVVNPWRRNNFNTISFAGKQIRIVYSISRIIKKKLKFLRDMYERKRRRKKRDSWK